MHPLNVLIGCESSGTVRDALIAAGHNAMSCDLLPCEVPGPHYQGDVFAAIALRRWDMAIFHPPCTYLCSSGLHWNHRRPERAAQTEAALAFVLRLMRCDIPRWAIENPLGCISSRIRPQDQIIQPSQFGDDASKATCLWLRNLNPLEPTKLAPPRMVGRKPRWGNQTDSGQNKLLPSKDRWRERSRTYPGIAAAMAAQWPQPLKQQSLFDEAT